jgi:hypothetical protein
VNGNGSSVDQTSSTVFTVAGTGTAISNLIITGGWPSSTAEEIVNGGGILNSGVLTLTNSTIRNNGAFYNGGGIYNTGTLTVIGSTIAGNTAGADALGDGGGIDNGGGTLTVINSTVANNLVREGVGGGIAVDAGTATITNSTISGNSTGGGGGGISTVIPNVNNSSVVSGGTVTLANTIVSGNNAYLSDIEDGSVSYTDNGGNIVGYLNGTDNPVNNPNNLALGPLGNYGGPTQTMIPEPGSQALCAGTIANSPSQWHPPLVQIDIDQRGYPNYNTAYGQLPITGGSFLPQVCIDSGAVQTNYTSVQFSQSSYTGSAGSAVSPAVIASVTENGASRGAVPLTLSYSGPGTLSGNTATTVGGASATFSNLSVNTVGNGSLSTTIIVAGTSYISGSTSLAVVPSLTVLPGSESIFAGVGTPLSQRFAVSGGSGSYDLTNSGTLPAGLTLTPSGTATGSSWTLSGSTTLVS